MKPSLTILLLPLAFTAEMGAALAQPTLTAATSMPAAGQNYNVHSLTQFSPSTGGANQNWDFTTLPFVSGSPNSIRGYAACSTVPNCSLFPGTNLVDKDNGNTQFIYLAAGTSALSVTGIQEPGLQVPYSNPDDILRFPMVYGNNYVDAFSGTFNSGGTYYRTGNDSVKADGWGTLKTGAGTFANVMRVERIQTYRDSPSTGGSTGVAQYKVHTYTWYSPAYKTHLYTTSRTIITYMGSPTTTFYSAYTAGQSSTGIDHAADMTALEVFPVPAREALHVRLVPGASGTVELTLTDAAGRIMRHVKDVVNATREHWMTLATVGLSPGMYILGVKSLGEVRVKKVLIE